MLSDQQLLTQLQGDEPSSFETLFRRHHGRVWAILFRLLGSHSEADDVTQKVFLKLYHSANQINLASDEVSLIGWLYRVALNEGYNSLRSRKRRRQRQETFYQRWLFQQTAVDPAHEVEREETHAEVRLILQRLKPRDGQLLLLRHSGLSYKELAAVLNVSPASIGSMLTRAERTFAKKYRQAFGKEKGA